MSQKAQNLVGTTYLDFSHLSSIMASQKNKLNARLKTSRECMLMTFVNKKPYFVKIPCTTKITKDWICEKRIPDNITCSSPEWMVMQPLTSVCFKALPLLLIDKDAALSETCKREHAQVYEIANITEYSYRFVTDENIIQLRSHMRKFLLDLLPFHLLYHEKDVGIAGRANFDDDTHKLSPFQVSIDELEILFNNTQYIKMLSTHMAQETHTRYIHGYEYRVLCTRRLD